MCKCTNLGRLFNELGLDNDQIPVVWYTCLLKVYTSAYTYPNAHIIMLPRKYKLGGSAGCGCELPIY